MPPEPLPVPRVPLADLGPLDALDVPVVILGATDGWRMRSWRDDDLAAGGPALARARTSDRATFGPVFDPARPLASVPGIVPAQPAHRWEVSIPELLAATRRPGPPFVYYTEDVVDSFPGLVGDLQVAAPFVRTPERCLVSIWIGQAGVDAHPHFDAYDNFFVQLRGTKRFVLQPPEVWAALGTFPALHPSYAQARRGSLTAADLPPPLVADLGPGEMLWLPPLWWHHVTSLTPTLGVNLWSAAGWADTVEAASAAVERAVAERPGRLADVLRQLGALVDGRLVDGLAARYQGVDALLPTFEPGARLDGDRVQLDGIVRVLARLPDAVRSLAALDMAEVAAAAAAGAPHAWAALRAAS
jgi:hypothetical protein